LTAELEIVPGLKERSPSVSSCPGEAPVSQAGRVLPRPSWVLSQTAQAAAEVVSPLPSAVGPWF